MSLPSVDASDKPSKRSQQGTTPGTVRVGRRIKGQREHTRQANIDRALRLKAAGWTYEAIAKHLGYTSRQGAYMLVRAGLDARLDESVENYRKVLGDRLEQVVRRHIRKASLGDPQSAQVVIAATREHAKLVGAYAPVKSEVIQVACDITPAGAALAVAQEFARKSELDAEQARLEREGIAPPVPPAA